VTPTSVRRRRASLLSGCLPAVLLFAARCWLFAAAVLPADLDYERLSALSTEEKAKLTANRPKTLGDVARIQVRLCLDALAVLASCSLCVCLFVSHCQGVTPNAMMTLYVFARQRLKQASRHQQDAVAAPFKKQFATA
jgi:hypothetical protein